MIHQSFYNKYCNTIKHRKLHNHKKGRYIAKLVNINSKPKTNGRYIIKPVNRIANQLLNGGHQMDTSIPFCPPLLTA